MNGLENILSDFLSSPENMRMLSDMASSMGITPPGLEQQNQPKSIDGPAIAQLLSGFDKPDETSALLRALKPFLSDAMAQKVENTVTAARIAQAAGGFLSKIGPDAEGGK